MMRKGIKNSIIRRLLISPPALWYTRVRYPRLFDEVNRFVLFIGHGRSGSSLVGALLNAHRNIVMSNELNVFDYMDRACSRAQMFNLVYDTSRRQARKGSRGGGGYTYAVPDQWQGRHAEIQVIGDRKAGATAIQLYREPELLAELQSIVEVPLCFISVVRNPFDTLTTTLKKTRRLPQESQERHLERQIDHYFERATAIRAISETIGDESLTFVYHDRLVADPAVYLKELCEFLDVPANEEYLTACANIIEPRANITRLTIDWPPELIQRVEDELKKYAWLRDYRFADSD